MRNEASLDNLDTAAQCLTGHTPVEPDSEDSLSAVNINDLAVDLGLVGGPTHL